MIVRFDMIDGRGYIREMCESSDVDQIEKENEELKEALEAIVSCISNPRTGYQYANDYCYKTAMEALGKEV